MPPLRLVRRERFAQLLFAHPETPDYEHYITAGYSAKTAMTAATQLRNNSEIIGRIAELQQEAANDAIATVQEIQETLTQQIRARVTDFLTCSADGVWFYDIGPESLNTAAIKKIETTTVPTLEGDTKVVLTKLELHDPKGACAELSKMRGDYAPAKVDVIFPQITTRTINKNYEAIQGD